MMQIVDALITELDLYEIEAKHDPTIEQAVQPDKSLKSALQHFNDPPKSESLADILAACEFSDASPGNLAEWLLLARSTLVLLDNTLLKLFSRTVPLAKEIIYWESVVRKKKWRALYALQCNVLSTVAQDR
jgi:hypothetical protein